MHPFAYRSFILRFSVRLIPYRIKTAYEPVQVKAFMGIANSKRIRDCPREVSGPSNHGNTTGGLLHCPNRFSPYRFRGYVDFARP